MARAFITITAILLALVAIAVAIEIPEDFVLVPGGRLLHKSCVRHLPAGAMVQEHHDDGRTVVLTKEGETIRFPACAYEAIAVEKGFSRMDGQDSAQYDGYMQQASEYHHEGFTEISGDWTVPGNPTQQKNQVIYLWLGTDDYEAGNVVQPVLQWGFNGNFGGNEWLFVSWFVTIGSANVGPQVTCSVGDDLFGIVSLNATAMQYNSTALNQDTGESSELMVATTRTKNEDLALVAMEGYSLTSCAELPGGDGETFSLLTLAENGQHVTPEWQPATYYHDCGVKAYVNSSSTVFLAWQN